MSESSNLRKEADLREHRTKLAEAPPNFEELIEDLHSRMAGISTRAAEAAEYLRAGKDLWRLDERILALKKELDTVMGVSSTWRQRRDQETQPPSSD